MIRQHIRHTYDQLKRDDLMNGLADTPGACDTPPSGVPQGTCISRTRVPSVGTYHVIVKDSMWSMMVNDGPCSCRHMFRTRVSFCMMCRSRPGAHSTFHIDHTYVSFSVAWPDNVQEISYESRPCSMTSHRCLCIQIVRASVVDAILHTSPLAAPTTI